MSNNDPEIAEAFTRLLHEPAIAKVNLTQYEFEMACNAPIVYSRYGGYTWRQRKLLREIAKKLDVDLYT